MAKPCDIPTFEYRVRLRGPGNSAQEETVQAAYFQESGVFTAFKDVEHAVVDAFKTEVVIRISRSEKPVVR